MEVRYKLSNLDMDDFIVEIDRLWSELRTSESLQADAREAGISMEQIGELETTTAISVRKTGEATLDPATTAVIVSFAPVAAQIVADLWTHVFLPRIKERLGPDRVEAAEQ